MYLMGQRSPETSFCLRFSWVWKYSEDVVFMHLLNAEACQLWHVSHGMTLPSDHLRNQEINESIGDLLTSHVYESDGSQIPLFPPCPVPHIRELAQLAWMRGMKLGDRGPFTAKGHKIRWPTFPSHMEPVPRSQVSVTGLTSHRVSQVMKIYAQYPLKPNTSLSNKTDPGNPKLGEGVGFFFLIIKFIPF